MLHFRVSTVSFNYYISVLKFGKCTLYILNHNGEGAMNGGFVESHEWEANAEGLSSKLKLSLVGWWCKCGLLRDEHALEVADTHQGCLRSGGCSSGATRKMMETPRSLGSMDSLDASHSENHWHWWWILSTPKGGRRPFFFRHNQSNLLFQLISLPSIHTI